jgi:DNA repair exonuclease SbcCD ATPase subunit
MTDNPTRQSAELCIQQVHDMARTTTCDKRATDYRHFPHPSGHDCFAANHSADEHHTFVPPTESADTPKCAHCGLRHHLGKNPLCSDLMHIPAAVETPTEPMTTLTDEEIARLHRKNSPISSQRVTQAEIDGLITTIDALQQRIKELEGERDLAIAHDRQPYPTAAAYEAACNALNAKTERIRTLEEKLTAAERPTSTAYPPNALTDAEYKVVSEIARYHTNAHLNSAMKKLLSAACATDRLQSALTAAEKERDAIVGIKNLPYADQVTHLLAERMRLTAEYDRLNKKRVALGWKLLGIAIGSGAIVDEDDCPKPKEHGGADGIADAIDAHLTALRAEVEQLRGERDAMMATVAAFIGRNGRELRVHPGDIIANPVGAVVVWDDVQTGEKVFALAAAKMEKGS